MTSEEIFPLLAKNAKSAVLIQVGSNQVLFSKNADQELHVASLTKLMTMLIILEKITTGVIQWSDLVEISENAANTGGSIINLNRGDKLSVDNLFKGILIKSGNDASVALAEHISGTVENFVDEMNKKAKDIGLQHSHFMNPHGISKRNHYSSASDLAKICLKLLKHEEVLKYSRLKEVTIINNKNWQKQLINTNPLLGIVPEIDGLKTGFTPAAGFCYAVTALKNNMRLLLILIGEPSRSARNYDVTALLNYGFRF
jgi:D-alanyl-D-alanine carboxypeptidase